MVYMRKNILIHNLYNNAEGFEKEGKKFLEIPYLNYIVRIGKMESNRPIDSVINTCLTFYSKSVFIGV